VRIDHHHPDGTLLGIVHSEALDGANQFADLATGTSFRHHSQLPSHDFLLPNSPSLPINGGRVEV